ncbi:MAG: membrane protein insertion efficiency factor YidD [Spirochaetia bacterium]
MKRGIIFFIKLYQRIAPNQLRQCCRFEPSCSNYMIVAIQKYGTIKGVLRFTTNFKMSSS